MRYVTIVCDLCGSQKRASNGWFVARESGDTLEIRVLHSDRIDATDGCGPGRTDLCGLGCLVKWMAKAAGRMGVNLSLGDVDRQATT